MYKFWFAESGCMSNPCLNSGGCSPNSITGEAECACLPAFVGVRCETRK